MTFKGINFRQSAVHPSATDSADDTYWHKAGNENYPSAVRGAFSGFGQKVGTPAWVNGGDRSGVGVDARLAGMVSSAGTPGTTFFLVNLPNGPGQYKVRLAMGDRLAARSGMQFRIRDGDGGTSLHFLLSVSTGAADSFADATGAIHTAANWPASNATVEVTFTGSVAALEFGADSYLNHIAFQPVAPASAFTGNITLDALGTSGTFQGVASGAFAGAITLDDVGVTGSFGASSGTLTSEPLRTNNGTLLASTALAHVAIYNDTTGALVLRRTSISTDGAGVFTITDPAIVTGVTYRIDWETSGGHRRMPRKLAA